MRILDKSRFYGSLFVGISAPVIWIWRRIWPGWVVVLFWAYLVIEGLYLSLSREGLAEARRRAARDRQIRRKLFGPLAEVAADVPLWLFGGGIVLAVIIPGEPPWLRLVLGLLTAAALAYIPWYLWVMRKHREMAEAKETELV